MIWVIIQKISNHWTKIIIIIIIILGIIFFEVPSVKLCRTTFPSSILVPLNLVFMYRFYFYFLWMCGLYYLLLLNLTGFLGLHILEKGMRNHYKIICVPVCSSITYVSLENYGTQKVKTCHNYEIYWSTYLWLFVVHIYHVYILK